MLEFVVLGSSSSGNSVLVKTATTAVLVDAGFSARETVRRLRDAGIAPDAVRAVCVSHEHSDHIRALPRLQRQFGIPLFANQGTIEGIAASPGFSALEWRVFETGAPFEVGDIAIHPFSVPHDAYEPVGFILEHAGIRLGVVTDLGMPTTLIRERLRLCHGLVLEANHDEDMLRQSRRPHTLIQRILGRLGHLSNEAAASLLTTAAGPDLEVVFLAHLSGECNTPRLAETVVGEEWKRSRRHPIRIEMTWPDRISARGILTGRRPAAP